MKFYDIKPHRTALLERQGADCFSLLRTKPSLHQKNASFFTHQNQDFYIFSFWK